MGFKVAFTKEALKSLKKLDKGIARLITSWIRKNLEGCTDPRAHGKGLVANRSGQWRYRIGDYSIYVYSSSLLFPTIGTPSKF